MFKAYLKKNYEKLISTFVAIIVALVTDEIVNSSEMLKDIVNNEVTAVRVFIWIIQVIVIMLFTILVDFGIKRFKANTKRRNIRFKKNYPFQNCTKSDKQKDIENKIEFLNENREKIEKEINTEIDTKLYIYKHFSICLEELTSLIINLIYYKEQCITSIQEQPIASKFSVVDINFYYSEIKNNCNFINEKKQEINKINFDKEYQINEVKYIGKIIDLINDGLSDIENLLSPSADD